MNNCEAVTRLFGFATVRKALDNREAVTSYGSSNALLVSSTLRTISAKLQISESSAIAYCQSLDTDLQHCVVCSLLQNLTDDLLQKALQDV